MVALGSDQACDDSLSALECLLECSLEQTLERYLSVANHQTGNAIITRARHREALTTAYHHLCAARQLDIASQTELVAEEFRAAAQAMSRILGYIDVEDVLDHIFSRFCIGK